MGFQLEIEDCVFEMQDFTVDETSTPLSGDDTSGQVGTIRLTVLKPDGELGGVGVSVNTFGPQVLKGKHVRLTDSRKGFTLGRIREVQDSHSSALFTLICETRLGFLNVFNVQAEPFVGSLRDAFKYYASLADQTTDVFVDPDIALQDVVFPGFSGELWFRLKQMATALQVELSLVSGNILLRPVRSRTATSYRDTDRQISLGGSLAQFVEVTHYNNRQITDELVYPPGGWSEEVNVINVNAGEFVEQRLELSASVSSIVQPVMQTSVSQTYGDSSVFTVVGDDGFPVPVALWESRGGSLEVVINEDTTSLSVKVQAPSNVPSAKGDEIGVFSIALSSAEGSGRYSTLRIVGSGVAFDEQVIRVPTGVTASESSTEVGAKVDNPFVSSLNEAYALGARTARKFSGRVLTVSGSVVAVNRLGDSGVFSAPPYSADQDRHAGMSYETVRVGFAGQTYGDVLRFLYATVVDDFQNQVFGNVSGARVWDQKSKRWFRIRSASMSPSLINFQGEDDLIHSDVEQVWSGLSYNDVKSKYDLFSYGEAFLLGVL